MKCKELQVEILALLWRQPDGLGQVEVYAHFLPGQAYKVRRALRDLARRSLVVEITSHHASGAKLSRVAAMKGGAAGYGAWREEASCLAS